MSQAAVVLVDTSVWVRFFRHPDTQEAKKLDRLLENDAVATCEPIRAEILSGALNERDFHKLADVFKALIHLEPPAEMWDRISRDRFSLAKRGYFCSLIDIWIAIVSQVHHTPLWSLDKDFQFIASVVSFEAFMSAKDKV